MASPEETNSPQYTTNSSTPDKSESPKVIQDSETPEYLDKLNEYYRLKNMYESSYKDKKNSILKDPSLNIKQKKTAILKIKRTCISCKRPVTTIFQSKDNFLYALCGDKANPCMLNIKINRGLFVKLSELINVFQEGVDENKILIIRSKLNLLFNFKTENDIISLFNEIKNELNNDLESLLEYKTSYIQLTENIDNKSLIDSKMTIMYEKIDLIKESIKQFNETGEIQFIKDLLQIYSDDLLPLINTLNKLKYKYYALEQKTNNNNENFYHLYKKKYTLQELLVPFDIPKIDSFQIGEKTKEIISSDKSLDLSKLDSKTPILEEPDVEEQTPTFKLEGNKLMFGNKMIANKMDFETNKSLLESQEEISPVMAHNKGYKFEMLYTRPSHPVLFAIDPDNGNIYVVDVVPSKKLESPDEEDIPPPPQKEEEFIPKTPPGTPPQIQIERAKQTANIESTSSPTSLQDDKEMKLVYDSEDDERNIGD
jgi:hypothetical protein|uniref:Uncharacterized protein n=1 Tax=viral metagenome TaxID=1070528 RepID=A0A6C0CW33_9ZZZZ